VQIILPDLIDVLPIWLKQNIHKVLSAMDVPGQNYIMPIVVSQFWDSGGVGGVRRALPLSHILRKGFDPKLAGSLMFSPNKSCSGVDPLDEPNQCVRELVQGCCQMCKLIGNGIQKDSS
jgi:hypothetical protein